MDAAKLRTLVDAARYDEAERLRHAINGQPEGELAFQIARLLVKTGRAAESGAFFLSAIRSAQADAGWSSTAVDVLIQQRCPEQARAVASWVVSQNPDDARLLLLLGKACSACRDDAAAQAALERCCSLDPNIEQAHRTLGLVHLRAGRWAEADAALRRAGELVPGNLTLPSYVAQEQLARAASDLPTPWVLFQLARLALDSKAYAQSVLCASQLLDQADVPAPLRAGACEVLCESARRSLDADVAVRALGEIIVRHGEHAPGAWVGFYRALLGWNDGDHHRAADVFTGQGGSTVLVEPGAFSVSLADAASARKRHFAWRRSHHRAVTPQVNGRSLVLLQACRPHELAALPASLADPLAKWGDTAVIHIHLDGFVGDVEALLDPLKSKLGPVPLGVTTSVETAPSALIAAYLAAPTVLGAYKMPVLINGSGSSFGSGAPVSLDDVGMADFGLRFQTPGRLALPWQLTDPRAAYFRPSADAFQLLGDVAEWIWDAVGRKVAVPGLLERAIGYAWGRTDPLAVDVDLGSRAAVARPPLPSERLVA